LLLLRLRLTRHGGWTSTTGRTISSLWSLNSGLPAGKTLHGHNLDTSNEGGLSTPQSNGSLAFFLLSSSQLFPSSAGFFLANLQFPSHLSHQFFGFALFSTHLLNRTRANGASFSLCS
jgi:hypothetical protein